MARLSITVATAGTAAVLVLSGFTASQAADDPDRPVNPDKRAMDEPVTKQAVPGPGHPAELHYVPIPSCRVVDTRKVGILGKSASRTYYVAGATGFGGQGGKGAGCGIPTSASAVVANLWLPKPKAGGSLKAWAAGSGQPGAPTAYYKKKAPVAQQATLTIRPGGSKHLAVKNAKGKTHLVIDVTGYYVPQMYAYISSSGVVLDHSGRLLSATRTGAGTYTLTWDRDVTYCAGQGSSDIAGRMVSVYTNGNSSYTYVYDAAGTLTDYWTNVTINC